MPVKESALRVESRERFRQRRPRRGIPGGVIGGAISVAPPPPPPPPPTGAQFRPPSPCARTRGSFPAGLQEAQLIKMVRPEYPPAAKIAHVQGTVRMQAVIDRDGNIIDLKVIDGHVMLGPRRARRGRTMALPALHHQRPRGRSGHRNSGGLPPRLRPKNQRKGDNFMTFPLFIAFGAPRRRHPGSGVCPRRDHPV